MNRRRRPAVQFEPLEGKQLLSTVHIATPSPKAMVQAMPQAFSLDGTLRMPVASIKTYVGSQGHHIGTFTLSGRLKGTGQVSGTYLAVLDANNQVMQSGGVTLTNRKGSVILVLANDPHDSTSYLFTVGSGTGAYSSAQGSGKLSTSGATPNGKTLFFAVHTNMT